MANISSTNIDRDGAYHLREVWALKHGSRQGGPSTSGSTRSRPVRYTRYRGTLVGGDDDDDYFHIFFLLQKVVKEKMGGWISRLFYPYRLLLLFSLVVCLIQVSNVTVA